jgi:hypothetical protein
MNTFLKSSVFHEKAVFGAGITIQTYGDFQNFNPHLYAIFTDDCFFPEGSFAGAPSFHGKDLEGAFQHEVFNSAPGPPLPQHVAAVGTGSRSGT